MEGLHLLLYVEPVIEICASRLPEWRLTKLLSLGARQTLTPRNPLEKTAFCAYFDWQVC